MVESITSCGVVPACVIDAGANEGQFSVAAAKAWPIERIYAFEPDPRSLRRLRSNCDGLGVKIYGIGLGDEVTTAHLNQAPHTHSSSFLTVGTDHVRHFPQSAPTQSVQVDVARLDGVLSPEMIHRPSLLKIDTQGYELRVIAGARELLPYIDYVVMEMSFEPLYDGEPSFAETVKEASKHGLEFVRPVGSLVDPASGKWLQFDGLFRRCS